MVMRLSSEWAVGDTGAEYEFKVKLSMRVRGVNISDEELQMETEMAVDIFAEELRRAYPWVGQVGLTGRSGGWLLVKDKLGRATEDEISDITERVDEARKDFEKALIDTFGYTENSSGSGQIVIRQAAEGTVGRDFRFDVEIPGLGTFTRERIADARQLANVHAQRRGLSVVEEIDGHIENSSRGGSNGELAQALEAFMRAGFRLDEAWEKSGEDLSRLYPFSKDFGDVTAEIDRWVRESKKDLGYQENSSYEPARGASSGPPWPVDAAERSDLALAVGEAGYGGQKAAHVVRELNWWRKRHQET